MALKSKINSASGCIYKKKKKEIFHERRFRGDTKEHQRAVNTVQLHSQGKEKKKQSQQRRFISVRTNPRERTKFHFMRTSLTGPPERERGGPAQSFNLQELIDRDISSGEALKKTL